MEIVKYLLAILCFLYSCSNGSGQVSTQKRFSERSKEERERALIDIAKKVVTNPKYKRLYHPYDRIEIVERKMEVSSPKDKQVCYDMSKDDIYYLVRFYHNQMPQFEWHKFAMSVMILDENGAAVQFVHGNGPTAFICGEPLYQAEPRKPKITKPKISRNRNRRF